MMRGEKQRELRSSALYDSKQSSSIKSRHSAGRGKRAYFSSLIHPPIHSSVPPLVAFIASAESDERTSYICLLAKRYLGCAPFHGHETHGTGEPVDVEFVRAEL